MWASGIVLYELLTIGKHPIYNKGDINKTRTREGYWQLIMDLKTVELKESLDGVVSSSCISLLEGLLNMA